MTFSDLAPETREALWRLARERLDAKDVDGTGMHVTLQAPLPGGAEVPVRFPVLTFADGTHALGEPVIVEPKAYTMGVDFGAGYRQEYPALSEMPWIQPGDKLKFLDSAIFGGTYTVRSATPELLESVAPVESTPTFGGVPIHPSSNLGQAIAMSRLASTPNAGAPGAFAEAFRKATGARPFPKTRAPFKRAEPKP